MSEPNYYPCPNCLSGKTFSSILFESGFYQCMDCKIKFHKINGIDPLEKLRHEESKKISKTYANDISTCKIEYYKLNQEIVYMTQKRAEIRKKMLNIKNKIKRLEMKR